MSRLVVPAILLAAGAACLLFLRGSGSGSGTLFAWSDLPGHVSYTLIAVSYWLTNIFWLRVTAVVGLAFEIVYFRFSGGNMHTGIGWDVIFILINLYQIYCLLDEKRRLASLQDVHLLRQGAFAGLEDAHLSRLVQAGGWKDFAAGEVLTREGSTVSNLTLICRGDATVEAGGSRVASLSDGALVGEMAFATGHPASATVTLTQPTRAFVFDMAKLSHLAENDESVAGAIHRIVGRDLAAKLRQENDAAGAEAADRDRGQR